MWVAYSLLAAFFFALVHVLDEYCVGEIFEKPWFGVITSSIASIVVFQLIPFVAPFVDMSMPATNITIMAISAGILIQASQALYFKALSFSEAGIVAAYWNFVPAFLPVVSHLAFGTVFSGHELLGIIILVSTSVALCILDVNFETRWKSFFLMIAAASLQVIAYIFEDVIFSKSAFFPAFFLISFGLIITGMIPLAFKKVRHTLRRNTKRLIPLIKFFLIIEIFNLIALFFAQKGIKTGDAPLVAAIETTMPAHAFLLSAVLVFVLPSLSNRDVLYKLPQKIIAIGFMILGVYFIS
jgi:drug/metabolite transporter (DMT)-like permease